ncbi:ccaat/enhancer binding protein [Holotrichia oblita]|uniref:Ccaat/enhancer binding protein n=1 Tax=Holotrichia oblita TaxID=644536 RepID=A0ACB9TLR0_HOLOL|nr:ccaat/enhancer binding protein [Holotrichia oblita]
MTVSDMAPKRGKPRKEMDSEEDGDEYRKKRDRNNMAVKRSRQKSKIKTAETMHRVNTLKSENTILQEKVKTLTKELGFLKELFLAHAGNSADKSKFEDVDLQQLLGEDTPSSDAMK